MDKKYLIPIGIVLVVIAATIYIVSLLQNDDETIIIYCGSNKNQPMSIFKNPTKAFPAFANDYTVKLNAGVSFLDTIKSTAGSGANASSEVSTKAGDLREKLNQDNIRMENLLKANFYAFNTNPCDSFTRRKYYAMLDTLTLKITEIEKFRAGLTVQTQKGTNVITDNKEIIKDSLKIKESLDAFAEQLSLQ